MNSPLKSLFALSLVAAAIPLAAQDSRTNAIIRAEPLSGGRIEPTLFGNFMELLDDVVPGSWAELLNDRSFAGVLPAADWVYYDGSLDICDRQWDTNATWSYDADEPFQRETLRQTHARPRPGQPHPIGPLGAKRHGIRLFHLICGGTTRDQSHRPAQDSAAGLESGSPWPPPSFPPPSSEWQKCSVKMTSVGQTDRAVFELRAEGQGRLWVNKLSLMPGDNQKGWRADVVEAIKEIRPGILRWGGSTVDPGRYRWKNGIGDRDRRTPWPNQNLGPNGSQ